MANNQESSTHKNIGPWTPIHLLGQGGNSSVWLAHRGTDPPIALKVLNKKDTKEEAFKRFQYEVEIHRRLGNRPGILPCIDSSLDPPRPWLAMPVAIGIRDAITATQPLETVVEAIAAIADTLAELAIVGIHHRDIKPSNLYRYENQWVIGDFGLVSFPDKEAITSNARQVGPRNFTAPEMIADPMNADSGPADVYSLAKTLWVLATGQNWPPPGPQRVDDPAATMGGYIKHPRLYLLENLIAVATQNDPKTRPSMPAFSRELHAWLTPLSPNIEDPDDLSDLARRLEALTESQRRAAQMRQQQANQQQELLKRLTELIKPVAQKIQQSFPFNPGQIILSSNVLSFTQDTDRLGIERVWFHGASLVINQPEMFLCSGFGVEFFSDGQVCFTAAHIIRASDKQHNVVWAASSLVPVNSAQQEQALAILTNGLNQNCRPTLERLVSLLERL